MQREFNQGVNQLPLSSVGVNQFPLSAKVVASEPTCEHSGCFEISSFDEGTATYQLKRPTAASLPSAQVLFTSAKGIQNERVPAGYSDPARWVAFDTTNGTPSVGDDVGTQEDSYKMLKDNTGFKCIAYNTTEGLCLVRPFSSGSSIVTFGAASTLAVDEDITTLAGYRVYNVDNGWVALDSSVTLENIAYLVHANYSGTVQAITTDTIGAGDYFNVVSVQVFWQFADADDNVQLTLNGPKSSSAADENVKNTSTLIYGSFDYEVPPASTITQVKMTVQAVVSATAGYDLNVNTSSWSEDGFYIIPNADVT